MLTTSFGSHYDFVVCVSGSSGSVIARRLAEYPDVSVLLLEAGGSDDVPQVSDPVQWPTNLTSERDWSLRAEPSTAVNGRSVSMSVSKVLGGGSSINVMAWARGHKNDWDYFAAESGAKEWGYSQCSTSTGGSRTGTANRIPPTGEQAARSMFSRRRIPARWPAPRSRPPSQ
jgi:choline dehydrogenase